VNTHVSGAEPRGSGARDCDLSAIAGGAIQRFDPSMCVYAVFADICTRNSDAVAIKTPDQVLTYRDLEAAAGNVAAQLALAGVRAGDFVALLESRSVDAIIGMLGILRAGAAYVPLDPTHAPEQLGFIATDIPFRAALVAARYADKAPELFGGRLPVIDLAAAIKLVAPRAPVVAASGDDPAYVLYTSGTSGAPKGVILPHKAIAAYVLDQPMTGVRASDVVLHASTIACDGSVFDIFAPLLNGASVAVVAAPFPSLDDIASVILTQKVTAVLWYAGIHHLMIDHRLDAFESLRLNCAGGDVMSPDHAQRLLAAWPGLTLCNLYGPTEATVDALGIEVTADILAGGPIPIGRPLAQYQAFVVDEALAVLPAGQSGQLVLAGPAIALGYHGRPDLTAKAFVADPRPGHRGQVYLTGDLAQADANGVFMFLGRADRQVKLAGRRIELDGIEHALRVHPNVADAVVEVIQHRGTQKIAAVLKPANGLPTNEASFIQMVMAATAETIAEATLPRLTKLVKDLPLTPAGKVDRKAVRAILMADAQATVSATPTTTREVIANIWHTVLGCGDIADDMTFFAAGGTSVQLIDAHARLETALDHKFDLTLMFETPSLGDLAMRLETLRASRTAMVQATPKQTDTADKAIAITGLAGRFPGAASVDEFWQHIRAGTNLIPVFERDQMEDVLTPQQRADPAYKTARPILPDVDMFDAKFFDMLPFEAAQMDPQARVFLEICVEALEDAGLDPTRAPGPIGVFAGATISTYLLANLMQDRAAIDEFTASFQIGNYAALTGNTNDNLAGRVAYKLNLKGPAMAISTACSTSLTAIAQACQSLRSGQSDAALAGGVSITFPQKRGYLSMEGGMASTDGVCRPFDADACGTVFGHGAGVVVLKRLADAVAAGDQIYGVICGAGVNNDGSDKMSYTAPSVAGQAAAIRTAQLDAGIDGNTISYVECHGTATPLGDPIELSGLAQGFGGALPARCAIGSVKGNIGHLDAAAGVMGVIKTALMLRHREIPPVANYRAPNPKIVF